jgi:ABC-2 type transport system permease protein
VSSVRLCWSLVRRALSVCGREPSLVASPLLMSGFFLVVYEGQFSALGADLAGGPGGYVDVVLPLCLLTTAFTAGAVSGQLIVRDIASGYHARLLVTPARRWVLVAAPVAAASLVVAVQALLLLILAVPLGLRPAHPVAAWCALVAATTVVGVGVLLLAAAAAVRFGTPGAVSGVTLVFFPLSFLSAALVPRDRLEGWMAVAADVNPLTYLLQGMRTTVEQDWSGSALVRGGSAAGVLLAVGLVTAWSALAHQRRNGA